VLGADVWSDRVENVERHAESSKIPQHNADSPERTGTAAHRELPRSVCRIPQPTSVLPAQVFRALHPKLDQVSKQESVSWITDPQLSSGREEGTQPFV
jgi:hypothetical protein